MSEKRRPFVAIESGRPVMRMPPEGPGMFGTWTPNPNGCGCWTCNPNAAWFVVCATCGNKRCPKANDHAHECTGSNEPGQKGSAYE